MTVPYEDAGDLPDGGLLGPYRTPEGCEWEHYIGSNETTDEWCLTHGRRLDVCRVVMPSRTDRQPPTSATQAKGGLSAEDR